MFGRFPRLPAPKPRLLCVDDDAQCLSVRRILLEAHGFTVVTTTSPRQALRLYRLKRFDAAVIDFQMPDMDGGVLAQEMKTARADVPVIILSGLPYPPENIPQAYDRFLCKTESGFRIVKEIKDLISNANSRAIDKSVPVHQKAFMVAGIAVGMASEGLSEAKTRARDTAKHAFGLKAAATH